MRIKCAVDDIEFGSTLSSVEVPPRLREKISTGVPSLDHAFGGQGMTPSVVTLFTGTPGAGKTTMMLSMCDALAKSGHQAIFNTAEESLYQVKLTAERTRLQCGFKVGQENNVDSLLKKVRKVVGQKRDKHTVLVVDSLQTLDDGHFSTGRITCASAERSLEKLTSFAKETFINVFVIGHVTKDGKMAGSNRLKHMVDAFISMDVDTDEKSDFFGCRRLTTNKHRFGGSNAVSYLKLHATGFTEIARSTDDDV